jgi:hypothetical protein
MKAFAKFATSALVACVTLGLVTPGTTRGVGFDWSDFTITRIVEPKPGTQVLVGKEITIKCVSVIDWDVLACGQNPALSSDPIQYTWTATSGNISHSSGTEATWTPTAPGNATITVTADDDTDPEYDNHTPRTHTLTLEGVARAVVYVDADRPSDGDGTTWATAFKSLPNAIAHASAGSELRVAEGIYMPDSNSVWNSITLDKAVKLYGGFAGTEVSLQQRDWIRHPTILSGDINGSGGIIDLANSRSVVHITDSGAVLDGFVVTAGYGDYTDGAGVNVEYCSPTVQNCTIKENCADSDDGDGGGMHCYSSSPTVVNCVFLANEAGDDGGGLCNKTGSSGQFVNCAFYNNRTHGDGSMKSDGGAIFNTASEHVRVACNPSFVNCVIACNKTKRYGGGAATAETSTPVSVVNYVNCTFFANDANDIGGALAVRNGCINKVKNCILWHDTTDTTGPELGVVAGTFYVTYSDVEGGSAGDHNFNLDPQFADPNMANLDGNDDRWLTCDDGLRIMFHSPCVDDANSLAKSGYTVADANERDALGFKHVNIRMVADGGLGASPWYDVGAYEAVVQHAIFISVDGLAAEHLQHSTLMGNASTTVMPNMKKFRDRGLWTTIQETLPNHTSMITGRPVERDQLVATGIHHGYTANNTPDWTNCLHNSGNLDGHTWLYKAGPFDVTDAAGMTSAMYAGKDKFILFDWSYSYRFGGDVNHTGATTDLLDTFEWTQDTQWNTDIDSTQLLAMFLPDGQHPKYDYNFVFFHFKGPDKYGHHYNWDSTEWDNGVKIVDQKLGTILNVATGRDAAKIPLNPDWYYNTVVILTADHGGSGGSHTDKAISANYTIPFGVWGHLIYKVPRTGPTDVTHDMYNWCDRVRLRPALGTRPLVNDAYTNQPIRHADGVDLALDLLGLDSIPGALIKGMKLKYNVQP